MRTRNGHRYQSLPLVVDAEKQTLMALALVTAELLWKALHLQEQQGQMLV